jgi:hypothetical protein
MFILVFIFAIASIWDGFTTVVGTHSILGQTQGQIPVSVMFSLVILGFMIGTSFIRDFKGAIGGAMKIAWWIALCYDLGTSYYGNRRFIIQGDLNLQQNLILIGITLLVTASPIFLSLIWHHQKSGIQ